ncbi:thioredoxin family protein [Bowmanella sp. JS7-9]|uniref:TlpA family protein disulfide reductase n=1 Tax=Pseudobowmanella zhangzhouensis TaxID=1537679 RepID=A0ABW1XFH7_9ALTE|nr:redoxin family protein [Bowmanella sp. JS7-9]
MNLGPFALPEGLVALFVLMLSWLLALRLVMAQKRRRDVIVTLSWNALVIGLFVARLIFLFRFHELYASPLAYLDIRDGGWHVESGVLAGLGYLLTQLARRRLLFKPLLRAGLLTLIIAAPLTWWWHAQEAGDLPDMQATELDGTPVSLASFKGKPVVINVWASWCPPCRREMPVLIDAQQRYPHVTILLLNQGEHPDSVSEYLRGMSASTEHVLLDPAANISNALNVVGLPTTLFFDANGKLISKRMGEFSKASLHAYLRQLSPDSTTPAVKNSSIDKR